jgi:hypothetical protein
MLITSVQISITDYSFSKLIVRPKKKTIKNRLPQRKMTIIFIMISRF